MRKMAFHKRFENLLIVRSIHHGLTIAIPFLIIGSIALLLNNLPIDTYQLFIKETFANGLISTFFVTLYSATLGSLALVLILTISVSYGEQLRSKLFYLYPAVALLSYVSFCGGITDNEDYIFGATWIFTAMVITLLSCTIFHYFEKRHKKRMSFHSMGADYYFNLAISFILPLVIIFVLFAMCGIALRLGTGNSNVTNFGSFLFLKLFHRIGKNLFGVLVYIFATHFLWFIGVHGTNTLEAVAIELFEPSMQTNQALIAAGKVPTEIFSRTFLDSFVFLGGCGCALSLILAMIFFSKRKHTRKLGVFSAPTVLFNINEIPMFGYPVVFNTSLLIPFIVTPMVLTLISYFAFSQGLVPIPTETVGWTVPIIISGYKATGSIAGSLLQAFNLLVGVLIYAPFVKVNDAKQAESYQKTVRQIEKDVLDAEKFGTSLQLMHRSYPYNYEAKALADDLRAAIALNQLELFYQPQINAKGKVHGLEALLRWNHPSIGYIAPPVLIMLATEQEFLDDLTYYVMQRASRDSVEIYKALQYKIYLSINISPNHMEDSAFLDSAGKIMAEIRATGLIPVFEFTERTVMNASEAQLEKIKALQKAGNEFSIDDFGMGNSSIVRLQENSFNEVKLDGSIVSQLTKNERSKEIILSIMRLSKSLNFRVVAEFVETKEERDILEECGCNIYQGYYFSRPLPLPELMKYLDSHKA